MEQKDESYILTDIQLQLLLQGCGCMELYGLPLKCWEQDVSDLFYQIHGLLRKQILQATEEAFYITEPIRNWLLVMAHADVVQNIWINRQIPKSFFAYVKGESVVLLERYLYQKDSIRLEGFEKSDFYEEIFQMLEESKIRENKEFFSKELFLEIQKEIIQIYYLSHQEIHSKENSIREDFWAEVYQKNGEYQKKITVLEWQLENYLVLEMEQTIELFPFYKDKLKELLEI